MLVTNVINVNKHSMFLFMQLHRYPMSSYSGFSLCIVLIIITMVIRISVDNVVFMCLKNRFFDLVAIIIFYWWVMYHRSVQQEGAGCCDVSN